MPPLRMCWMPFYASSGIYDTRIGNEPKDAYTRIEAGEYDIFSVVHAEGNNLCGSLSVSWAFYSNVQFGEIGAEAVCSPTPTA